jgi:hypothetical protein
LDACYEILMVIETGFFARDRKTKENSHAKFELHGRTR